MQDTQMASSVDAKPTRLVSVLNDDKAVLERVCALMGRLAEMEVRLFGERKEGITECAADAPPSGILGQFESANAETRRVLEAINQSLANIESAV